MLHANISHIDKNNKLDFTQKKKKNTHSRQPIIFDLNQIY